MAYDRTAIKDKLAKLSAALDTIKTTHTDVDVGFLRSYIGMITDSHTDDQLKNIMENAKLRQAFIYQDAAGAAKLYADLGITTAPVLPCLPPASGRSPEAIGAELTLALTTGNQADIQRLTLELAAASKSPDGSWNPAIVAPAVGLISKFLLGTSVPEAAKYSALSGLAIMAWNWFNSPDGKKTLEEISTSLGVGGEGFAGLLSGGAGGIGEFIKNAMGALGGVMDNPSIKAMLDWAKEQPILAMAMAYIAATGNFSSIGGIFETFKTALIMVAVAWAAETYLGIDLSAKGKGQIIADAPSKSPTEFIPAAGTTLVGGAGGR